ncbi:hypothetical protein [Paracoccus beibuensis]|uniref:hypothetical protein n=1 Tax=Paracoccus beibuensis TaxID=547602 RepID=UPI00223EF0A3|nr:hypothetical protein [Paracoccus beibuensis]
MDKETVLDALAATGAWAAANSLVLAQVLAAVVTAVATIALWRVTRVLAVETTTLAKMTAQPFVVCWLESSAANPLALNLTLRNTGNATAFDISLRITPALPAKYDDRPGNEGSETTFAVSLLPPGQALSIRGVKSELVHDTVFNAELGWADRPGSPVREAIAYSFDANDGFRFGWVSKGLHDVAQELERIRKRLPKA